MLEGSKTYEVLEGAQFVINTAGVPRAVRPDGTFPSREELLATNLKITDAVAAGIKQYCPDATIVSRWPTPSTRSSTACTCS